MDDARLDRILAALPPDDAAYLASLVEPPWKVRARRLTVRDAAVLDAFAAVAAMQPTPAATYIASQFARYLASAWAIERGYRLLGSPDVEQPGDIGARRNVRLGAAVDRAVAADAEEAVADGEARLAAAVAKRVEPMLADHPGGIGRGFQRRRNGQQWGGHGRVHAARRHRRPAARPSRATSSRLVTTKLACCAVNPALAALAWRERIEEVAGRLFDES